LNCEELPSVSGACYTYNRLSLLRGSVKMFVDQVYGGKKELVILNDDPKVKVVCDHDEVVVFNWERRFKNIREKVAKTIELCTGEVIIHWPDDDLFKPWTISTYIKALDDTDFCAPAGFYKEGGGTLQFIGAAIAGMHAIRKEAWDRIGGAPLYDPKSLKVGIKRRAADTAFYQKLKDLGMYREHILKKEEVFFTWRSTLADHSMWRDCPETHPERFALFDGIPKEYKILV